MKHLLATVTIALAIGGMAFALPMKGNNASLARAAFQGAGFSLIECPQRMLQDKQNTYICAESNVTVEKTAGAWDDYALLSFDAGTEWEWVINPFGTGEENQKTNGLARGYFFQNTKFLFVAAPPYIKTYYILNRMWVYLSVGVKEPQIK
jgi:hypothetical protein